MFVWVSSSSCFSFLSLCYFVCFIEKNGYCFLYKLVIMLSVASLRNFEIFLKLPSLVFFFFFFLVLSSLIVIVFDSSLWKVHFEK